MDTEFSAFMAPAFTFLSNNAVATAVGIISLAFTSYFGHKALNQPSRDRINADRKILRDMVSILKRLVARYSLEALEDYDIAVRCSYTDADIRGVMEKAKALQLPSLPQVAIHEQLAELDVVIDLLKLGAKQFHDYSGHRMLVSEYDAYAARNELHHFRIDLINSQGGIDQLRRSVARFEHNTRDLIARANKNLHSLDCLSAPYPKHE